MAASSAATLAENDLFSEGLVPLGDVPKLLPKRQGKPPHISTAFRWAQRGIHGVRLEVIQAGGVKCTSRPALSRFFQRLSDVQAGRPVSTCSPARRQRAIARAEAELAKEGI